MEVKCRKCSAPKTCLSGRVRDVENGERSEEIYCRLCGDILATRPVILSPPGKARAVAMESELRESQKAPPIKQRRYDCAVIGCDKTHFGVGKFPLCDLHRRMIRAYNRAVNPRKKPPIEPLPDGRWVENNSRASYRKGGK